MNMIIEEYWETCGPEMVQGSDTMRKVNRGVYEKTGRVSYPNMGGWKTEKEFIRRARKRHGFTGIEDGKARFDRGVFYGIRGYQLVFFEN